MHPMGKMSVRGEGTPTYIKEMCLPGLTVWAEMRFFFKFTYLLLKHTKNDRIYLVG